MNETKRPAYSHNYSNVENFTPSTETLPLYIAYFASRNVLTVFNISRKNTADEIDTFFPCVPGRTVTTNRFSFLVIPQNSGAICRFNFLLPAIFTNYFFNSLLFFASLFYLLTFVFLSCFHYFAVFQFLILFEFLFYQIQVLLL